MIRIGITGPESSGKTTLAKALSEELGASYISEFARKYLTELGRPYEQNDLIEIAKGQLNGILTGSSSLQIIDTDFIVLKIWLEEKYNSTSAYIEDLIAKNHFDLHILCTPDIPWEEDSLRENPDDRDRIQPQ